MKLFTRAFGLFFILLYVSTYVKSSYAQAPASSQYSLRGIVYENGSTTAVGANVQLLRAKDSSLVKIDLSDKNGKYAFDNLAEGTYKLKITYVGFSTYWSENILLNRDTDLARITLKEASAELKEVTVTANKPLIEQQMDKLVLNVAGSIAAAGSTALEVLEKAPGIRVDQNDNISMRGKQGVMVMIDGKRVPMSGQELANMLRGMSADAIEKIDLITNPSAKYDAAGNAGIIDIRLKKDKRNGTNGNLSLSYGQGRYGKSNDGLSINHRNKNLNVFGSYNYVFRKDYTALDLYRRFFDTNNAFSGAYNQDNNFKYRINSNNARLGMDYYLGKNTIIGFSANGILTGVDRTNQNLSEVLNTAEQKASSFLSNGRTASDRKIGSMNLNFKHTLDSAGSELNADIDLASYGTQDEQHYITNYYDLNNAPTQPAYLLFGDLGGQLDIRSAKIDYSKPFKSGLKLEAGVKSSLVEADNDLKFYDQSGGGNVLDVSKSNHFIYKENINALYVNASKKWGKSGLQLGVRLENTNADGNQVTTGERFENSYSQFFPSAAFTHKINKANDIGITLSRRINRPTYNQLNPFKYFLDPSTYSSGNPFLRPQTSYSFELTHTINQKYMITYGYSRTTDNIISVLSPAPGQDKVTIQTDRNLAKLDYYGINVAIPVTIGNWLNSTNNFAAYYNLYRGNLANTNLDAGRPTFNFNTTNNIVLSKTLTAEVSGTIQSREQYGFLDVKPIAFMSAGVQKQFWNKKASLKLNVTDVLYTNKVNAFTALTGYTETFHQQRDVQVATMSFSYRFGGNQVAPSRKRTGGAEDEKRRAG